MNKREGITNSPDAMIHHQPRPAAARGHVHTWHTQEGLGLEPQTFPRETASPSVIVYHCRACGPTLYTKMVNFMVSESHLQYPEVMFLSQVRRNFWASTKAASKC